MYVGGTESILTAQTGLMLVVIANVLRYQSQCKSLRLTVQCRLWSTVLFEIQCKVFVFGVGVTYWQSWGPRERATAARFPIRTRVFVAKMFRPAVRSTRHNRGLFSEEKRLKLGANYSSEYIAFVPFCRHSSPSVFSLGTPSAVISQRYRTFLPDCPSHLGSF
jgi:hypothetical protein